MENDSMVCIRVDFKIKRLACVAVSDMIYTLFLCVQGMMENI